MARTPYPTDLSDAQWDLIADFFPQPSSRGRKQTIARQEIVNAIFYVNRSGCQWCMLPHDFPKYKTVNHYYNTWRKSGIWSEINAALSQAIRSDLSREPTPSVANLDSQTVKAAK